MKLVRFAQNGRSPRLGLVLDDRVADVQACVISYLSGLMTLSPGDLIATGTPAGVGVGKKPPVFMSSGDTCRMEITGLGTIENPVKDA